MATSNHHRPHVIADAVKAQQRVHINYPRAITEMESHIEVQSDGNLVLDSASLSRSQSLTPIRQELQVSLQYVNSQLHSAQLGLNQVRLQTKKQILRDQTIALDEQCSSQNVRDTYWWGKRWWLDECTTRHLLDLMASGADAGTIVAWAFPLLALHDAAVTGLLGLGAAAIQAIDAQGNFHGITINRAWSGHLWVWHQSS